MAGNVSRSERSITALIANRFIPGFAVQPVFGLRMGMVGLSVLPRLRAYGNGLPIPAPNRFRQSKRELRGYTG